jgi:hypothetical protein
MATAMALGQAAGTLAALACSANASPRGISSSRVRAALRAEGALVSIEDTNDTSDGILPPGATSGSEQRL